ncbi:MAG: hypothetical protein VXU50_05330, partial [Verrucomicrobiota bacterium]|nr:hypothetical protein [Verrucomicrobiota bacterium]
MSRRGLRASPAIFQPAALAMATSADTCHHIVGTIGKLWKAHRRRLPPPVRSAMVELLLAIRLELLPAEHLELCLAPRAMSIDFCSILSIDMKLCPAARAMSVDFCGILSIDMELCPAARAMSIDFCGLLSF